MIAITAEFKGRKYLIEDGFKSFHQAEMDAKEAARYFPKASFYIADRQAHVDGCLSLTEFRKAYFSD